jgi:hypothetical protein
MNLVEIMNSGSCIVTHGKVIYYNVAFRHVRLTIVAVEEK